ncbi:lysozyme inhibitor LprI family protein [Reinekea marinisedimentorum]|nr:lysozyme inhibitor LprI family protein [Reinekea marinisedimentorum]
MEMIEKIGFVILGALLSWLFYFIKRRVENKPDLEKLDKHKKLLDIHKQMNDQDISIDGLAELELLLTGKAKAINQKNIALQAESAPLLEAGEIENLNQIELNERASRRVEQAKERMQKAIAGIDSRVGDFESQSLMSSQTEWESYSISQAEAAAASYREATIYPLIYLNELESLINERTARLQAELDELIKLGN